MVSHVERAVFGGGCFWCTEAVFKMLKGVVTVLPGYAGGHIDNPTYEAVCTGTTGHAEVVYLEYDPRSVSFETLLTIFFASHDPTTLNRQGADHGTQYRSTILYTSADQKIRAEKFIAELNASSAIGDPVVTTVEPLGKFYEAEEYHKNYYARNTEAGYCRAVINPKLKKVKEKFAQLLHEVPQT
jgi:peptide-methionine (S)-S-oxide reductase